MNEEQVEKIFIKKYEKSDSENFLLLRWEMISEK